MKTHTETLRTDIDNSFQFLHPNFIQLSPLGEFPHAKGVQIVDMNVVETVVKNFRSFLQRLGRRFSGAPIYIGHPDVPGCESLYPDHKAYGWIMEVHLKHDGLYGSPKWSKAGKELIENGHYKFLSPFWEASEAGFRGGHKLYRPHTLISVGLTNRPNLPMFPLANSRKQQNDSPGHRRFFGIPVQFPAGGAAQIAAAQAPEGQPVPSGESPQDPYFMSKTSDTTLLQAEDGAPTIVVPDSSGQNQQSRLESIVVTLQNTIRAMDDRLEEVNARFLTVLVDNAILDGRLPAAERESCRIALDRDFATKSLERV